MKSEIIKTTPPVKEPAPFTFPGLFRGMVSGNLFIASNPEQSVRVARGPNAHSLFEQVGASFPYAITPSDFEQVTDSVTIEFTP